MSIEDIAQDGEGRDDTLDVLTTLEWSANYAIVALATFVLQAPTYTDQCTRSPAAGDGYLRLPSRGSSCWPRGGGEKRAILP